MYGSYLDPALDAHRPVINVEASDNKLKYGERFGIQFNLNKADKVTESDVKATMYHLHELEAFLAKTELKGEGAGVYRVTMLASPTAAVAPPEVCGSSRSAECGMWVQIKLALSLIDMVIDSSKIN